MMQGVYVYVCVCVCVRCVCVCVCIEPSSIVGMLQCAAAHCSVLRRVCVRMCVCVRERERVHRALVGPLFFLLFP